MRFIAQALKYPFLCISAGGNVEQALIPFSILYDGGCLPIHSQHDRAFGLLQPLHEVTGCPAKRCQRLNVTRNVQHIHLIFEHPLRCYQNTPAL
jgi:hypothetical protein